MLRIVEAGNLGLCNERRFGSLWTLVFVNSPYEEKRYGYTRLYYGDSLRTSHEARIPPLREWCFELAQNLDQLA